MKHRDDGGPAFPVHPNPNNPVDYSTGMTLRQWYAGQALNGITTAMSIDPSAAQAIVDGARENNVPLSIQLARICVDYADALIAVEDAERST